MSPVANLAVIFTFMLIMLEAFQFGQRYGIANRSFYAISPGLIETAIAIPGLFNASDVPYFDKNLLPHRVTTYLSGELFPTFSEYDVAFFYYVPTTKMLCTSTYCQGVTIRLVVALTPWLDYDKRLSFEISEQP